MSKVDRGRGRPGNRKRFTVHLVRGNIFRFHRLKRSRADVQGDERVRQGRQHFVSEMQTGRRRRDGARGIRIDGLVAFQIFRIALPPLVRRQWNYPALPRI